MENRQHFLDNLRAFIILLVVILHVSICYMEFVPWWWYVISIDSSLIFTIFVLLLDVFIMPIMFLLSGYFLLPSLLSRSPKVFINSKKWRLLYPWLIGVILLAPLYAYSIFITRGKKIPFLKFMLNEFIGDSYQQAHYWFLGILLLFISLALITTRLFPSILKFNYRKIRINKRFFLVFYIITTVIYAAINTKFTQTEWIRSVIVFRPVHILNLFLYFILGIFMERSQYFNKKHFKNSLKAWFLLFLISQSLYLISIQIIPLNDNDNIVFVIINSLLLNFYCLSTVMFLLSAFYRYFNRSSTLLRSLSSSSYGIYFTHFIFILIVFYLEKTGLNIYIKFIVSLISTLVFSFILTSLFKRTPLLKKMF